MTRMSVRRSLGFAVLISLGVAGCGGDDAPSPNSFAPLHYDYLTKLRLNVGAIDIEDHSAPLGPDDISTQSPVTPAQALNQIGHDRLFAAGLLGQAQFVIDQASIVRGAEGALYGNMAVHLEVLTQAGTRAGYAEARVTRTHLPGSESENRTSVLYDMTRQMADAMNVELEYQIKRSMGDFIATSSALPTAVTATPLNPAASPPVLPPASVAAPPADSPLPPETPPVEMSPPPGYLHQPGEP